MSPPPDDNSMAHSLFGEDSIKETAAAHLLLPLVRDPLSQSPPATIPISRSRPPTSDLHRFRHFAYCAPTLGLRTLLSCCRNKLLMEVGKSHSP